ncbi:carbohydrate ABC transporter substrate-binding protein [Endozoicomonas sp. SM1973]|uniref:Probable sugar-binding periplasmic protein n=1 Tax=Spartinivicinus marinus TaxID=2994442 RepID=A0A853I7S8_9GAMM|nr:ABC transporter substrate-binding protein [Spartinivicinus marinus]MCX4027503.1 ABC transporter substrate-binding protein [Spartinivicinus marinus]NYZ68879.1 carbohydrate ABC transporter substrate-binding protein [Spartinivicinus marinus]
MNVKQRFFPMLGALILMLSQISVAGEVEVLHWWTSGGEARSLDVLKQKLVKQGHSWKDFAVVGGSGDKAMAVLKSRALSGFPPTATQILGHHIQEWGKLGLLTNLDKIANEQKWEAILPDFVRKLVSYGGHYVAVPVNVHRVNWLWVNPRLFKQAGAKIPTNLDEFWVTLETLKKAGITPIAHGDQSWQNSTVFELLMLAMNGAEFYVKAFVELDNVSLTSEKMVNVFTAFRKLKQYMDPNTLDRDWNAATSMVINGKAAMQIMGDWAKGEFITEKKQLGKDYLCVSIPSTSMSFPYVVDSFIMFEISDPENKKAQADLVKNILNKEFQQTFNMNKGSIPVRQDMVLDNFDACAKESKKVLTSKDAKIIPSLSHGMAVTTYTQNAIFEVITEFFRNDKISPKEATRQLGAAVQASL